MTGEVPKPTYVYRITHIANVPWILDHGLHCANGAVKDPDFVPIGLADLIDRRTPRTVPIVPGGTLADYVPFYFGTRSAMLYNIITGYNVPMVEPEQIVHLVTSVETLTAGRHRFLFTDRHAFVATAEYYDDIARLSCLDWPLIGGSDFKRDPNRPDKLEHRAAELLVHRHLPVEGLLGIVGCDETSRAAIHGHVESRELKLRVAARPAWYFR